MCSFCVCLCGWTRSLCLSALPSDRAPDEVIRTVTGVARLHCLYLAGVSVVRCQIVFTLVVSYSLCQSSRSGGCSRLVASQYSWRLETLHCRVYCTCTAGFTAPALPMISAPPLCFGVCTCTASLSHLHCVLELPNKDYLFFSRNWISSFLYRDTFWRELSLRRFWCWGNALRDMSWSTCEIKPRYNGTSERVTSRTKKL